MMFAWRLTRGGIENRESGGRSDLTLRFGTKPGTSWPDSAEGAGNCFHSQTSHLLPPLNIHLSADKVET